MSIQRSLQSGAWTRPRILWVGLLAVLALRLSATIVLTTLFPQRFAVSGTDVAVAYLPAAANIVAGHGLVRAPGWPLLVNYPPGYSLYLAGILWTAQRVGVPFDVLRLLVDTFGLGVLTGVGLFLFWRQLRFPAGIAALATAAFLLYPPYLWLSGVPDTVPLFTLFLVWSCVFWGRAAQSAYAWPATAGAGALFGAALLVRPILLLLPLVAVPWLAWRSRSWRTVAAFLAPLGLVIAPWIIIASLLTHTLVPLSSGGPGSIWDGLRNLRGNVVADTFREHQELQSSLPGIRKLLIQQSREHPLATLSLLARKAARGWYGTEAGGTLEWGLLGLNLPVAVLGFLGWRACRRRSGPGLTEVSPLAVEWLGLFLYFWGMTFLVLSILRYMVPVMWLPVGLAVWFACGSRRTGVANGAGQPL